MRPPRFTPGDAFPMERAQGLGKAADGLVARRCRSGSAAFLLALALICVVPAGAAQTPGAAACDRACLRGLADRLLDSMSTRNTSTLPLGKTYAATENSVAAALPMMSAWRTITATRQRFYVIDSKTQQVFVVAGLEEGPYETLLWGRLRIDDQQLTEIELYLNRSRAQGGYQFGGAGPANFPQAWTAAAAADRLLPRAQLLEHGRAIFDSRLKARPADSSCTLMENGKIVEEHAEVAAALAGGAPAAGAAMVPIPCGLPPERPTDKRARTPVVDEVQGIVVGQAVVHGAAQPMLVTTPTESAFVPDQILRPYLRMLERQRGENRYLSPALAPMPATAAVAEVHRVVNGRIQGQLLLVNLGAPGSRSPWVR